MVGRRLSFWKGLFYISGVLFFDDPKLPAAHSLKMPMAKDAEIV